MLVTSPVIQECLGTKAKYSCPTNNFNSSRMPDYVSTAGLQCKPCSSVPVVTDMNPVAGDFWVSLTWGPLVSVSGKFVETDIKGYSIYVVDSKGRRLEKITDVQKVDSSTSCCTADLYSATIAGKLPTGYDRFMVVPNIDASTFLPMGYLSDIIIDNDAGLAEFVEGSFKVDVSNAVEFRTNPAVREALREAVADTIPGITREFVRIVNVTAVSRRLRDAAPRKLTAGTVQVDYMILLPSDYAGPAISPTSIDPTALKEAINTRISARNIQGVTVTEVKEITAETTTLGTPVATSGACHSGLPKLFGLLLCTAASFGMLNKLY